MTQVFTGDNQTMDNRAIGVFDSGLGGLTVVKEIISQLPGESVIYFGDSGRAPYGTKSGETVIKYMLQDIRFLMKHNIKMIVIACNTMSAHGYDIAKSTFDIPIIEVIGAGATAAAAETRNKRLGIIGTSATINSGAYKKAVINLDNGIEVFQKACPLFVPLVEEGQEWWDNDITLKVAEKYLLPLKTTGVDTLVMGCTHYPLLYSIISKVMGERVTLVNSAIEVARVVKRTVLEMDMSRETELKPEYCYYTSDSVEKFIPLCSAILGIAVDSAEKIDIEKY